MSSGARPAIDVRGLSKTFTLHTQGGVALPVLGGIDIAVDFGECVVLRGPSGAGKSTLLRCIYGNYLASSGKIAVRAGKSRIDITDAGPRQLLRLRRDTIGYVTQFLRVVPRVATVDVVAEPLRTIGISEEAANDRARTMLRRVNIPDRLWDIPPATFSGGEQQRVNIARGFAVDYPILLLDEPTAALDPTNRDIVVELIREATGRGAAILGIFHDADVRDAVATRIVDLQPMRQAA